MKFIRQVPLASLIGMDTHGRDDGTPEGIGNAMFKIYEILHRKCLSRLDRIRGIFIEFNDADIAVFLPFKVELLGLVIHGITSPGFRVSWVSGGVAWHLPAFSDPTPAKTCHPELKHVIADVGQGRSLAASGS